MITRKSCVLPHSTESFKCSLLELFAAFSKSKKSKKAATRRKRSVCVSLSAARVGLFKRQKTFIFISILAKDVHATRSKSAALILPRNTGEEEEEEEDKARDIPSSREKYNNAQRRSSADTFLKEEDYHIHIHIS